MIHTIQFMLFNMFPDFSSFQVSTSCYSNTNIIELEGIQYKNIKLEYYTQMRSNGKILNSTSTYFRMCKMVFRILITWTMYREICMISGIFIINFRIWTFIKLRINFKVNSRISKTFKWMWWNLSILQHYRLKQQ